MYSHGSFRLYVRGLPEKLKKDALRRELYLLFSTYGPVLDIVTLKTMKMRGQAHIVFRDIQSATMAMRACADMEFHGKSLVCIIPKRRVCTRVVRTY